MTNQRWKELALGLALTSFAFPTSPTANNASSPPRLPAHQRLAPIARRAAAGLAVHATVYYPTGDLMASGRAIPVHYRLRSRQFRIIAISRDLRSRYGFGDTVRLAGDSGDPYWDSSLDGVYVVQDLMNQRHRKSVDILSQPGHERDIGRWQARISPYHAQKTRAR